uniref:Uncharacterized protein n=1 Tax=Arundo donax TaxID=35708 RepID=A0A0A9CT60_ARUDO
MNQNLVTNLTNYLSAG